jgi:CRP-like cAMP-binding protein
VEEWLPRGDLQGRVFSAFEAIMVCVQLLGALIVGPILAVASPRAATVAFAAVTAALFALCLPGLLRLESVLGIRIFLRAVPVFASLSRRALDDLGGRLRVEHYPPLTEVVRAGAPGDRLYIVKSGELEVIAHGERAQSVVVNTLTAMDYFGEIALLRGGLRTATVRSRGRVELYSLNRSDFHDLLRSSAELRQAVMETSEARYKRTEHMLLPRRQLRGDREACMGLVAIRYTCSSVRVAADRTTWPRRLSESPPDAARCGTGAAFRRGSSCRYCRVVRSGPRWRTQ